MVLDWEEFYLLCTSFKFGELRIVSVNMLKICSCWIGGKNKICPPCIANADILFKFGIQGLKNGDTHLLV